MQLIIFSNEIKTQSAQKSPQPPIGTMQSILKTAASDISRLILSSKYMQVGLYLIKIKVSNIFTICKNIPSKHMLIFLFNYGDCTQLNKSLTYFFDEMYHVSSRFRQPQTNKIFLRIPWWVYSHKNLGQQFSDSDLLRSRTARQKETKGYKKLGT